MRRGISPKYDLLQIEGAVHESTFVYRVTVGEFSGGCQGLRFWLRIILMKVNLSSFFVYVGCVKCRFGVL